MDRKLKIAVIHRFQFYCHCTAIHNRFTATITRHTAYHALNSISSANFCALSTGHNTAILFYHPQPANATIPGDF